MSPLTVDLNCDMGESFGAWTMGQDQALLPYITSANIACGFHAGDPQVMQQTVAMALQQGVALGAHPGLPDLQGFGRREMQLSPREAYALVLYQTGALAAFAQAAGGELRHVKPHGALYNMAAANGSLAEAIAEAVWAFNPRLILFGLAGSELVKAGQQRGLTTAQEVFADRTYQQGGSLTPRSQPNALISDPLKAVQQVLGMLRKGSVTSLQGTEIPIQADTICIHGDGPHALSFARQLKTALQQEGIFLSPLCR
jgi:5-oxoprolinase (ATP-hydrolysing) subunit A